MYCISRCDYVAAVKNSLEELSFLKDEAADLACDL